MVTSSYIFSSGNIFNICIIFIWFNATYIIPNFYCTILYYDCAIGPTLHSHKLYLIRRFIFLCSVIIEHDFISDFTFVVDSFYIFTDIIFINLRLIFLTY